MKNTDEEIKLPATEAGIEAFLSSNLIEGIGPAYAKRLTEKFGTATLSVLLNNPETAAEVPGIGEKRIASAVESIKKIPFQLDTFAFLYSCGLSESYIERIFNKYKKKTTHIVATDPYSMVEDVWQLSFFTADKIGRNLDIPKDDPRRLQAAIVTAVKSYAENGHLFATRSQAIETASVIAGTDCVAIESQIDATVKSGRIVESHGGLYLPMFYKAEKEGAQRLSELGSAVIEKYNIEDVPSTDGEGHNYTQSQREAILKALNSPVMVLTGGPGTGKTTVLRGIIETLEKDGKKITLAAPTGRAAKRMTMLTGRHASTIHSLLGYMQDRGYSRKKLDTEVLIIDEGSMMEQVLFNHLLQAIVPGTRVILVGDVDQLPAIGAGDVLRDMIDSPVIPVAHLNENFRQAEGSLIADGAKAINSGEYPQSSPQKDFMIIEEPTVKRIHERILDLMATQLPESYGIRPTEIQVVTPQQKGPLGARQLNIDLQQRLNPEGPSLKRGATIMRLGDPVMQTANSRDRGVYNGEVGYISEVSVDEQTLTVSFSDGRKSTYKRSELSELTLAYATTVHKLQGSEVKYMIFPITMAHKPMLYRNLLYTGVSRASKLCVLVGEEEAIRYAIAHTPANSRNTNFKERLQRIAEDASVIEEPEES